MRGLTLVLLSLAVALPVQVHASIFGSIFSTTHKRPVESSPQEAPAVPDSPPRTETDEFAQKTKNAIEYAVEATLPSSGAISAAPEAPEHKEPVGPNLGAESRQGENQLDSGSLVQPARPSSQNSLGVDGDRETVGGASRNLERSQQSGPVENGDKAAVVADERILGESPNGPPPAAGPLPAPSLSDKESTEMTEKALEEMKTDLGPQIPKGEGEQDQRLDDDDISRVPPTHRMSLSRGIEHTMVSLARVYDHLMKARLGKLPGKAHESSEPREGVVGTAVHESEPLGNGPGPMEAGVEALLAKQKETLKAAISGAAEREEGDAVARANVTGAERAAASEKPRAEESSPATAVLSVLAGLVFVAAIGLMIAGFTYSQRESRAGETSRAPLYPPSGPGFV